MLAIKISYVKMSKRLGSCKARDVKETHRISIRKLTSISKGVKEKSKKQIQIKILKKFLMKVWESVLVAAVSLNIYTWITRRIIKNDFTRKFQLYIQNHQKKALCSTLTSTDTQKLKKTWKATDCMWKNTIQKLPSVYLSPLILNTYKWMISTSRERQGTNLACQTHMSIS